MEYFSGAGPALPGDANPQSPLLADFDISWPQLPALTKHIKRVGWHARPMPTELTLIPDELQMPEKLQQILKWSVTPGDSWAVEPKPEPPEERPNVSSDGQSSRDKQQVAGAADGVTAQTEQIFPDDKSIRSGHSSIVSNALSTQLATDKLAWKSKFISRLGWRKPVARSIPAPRPPTPTAECIVCFEDLPVTELLQMDACRHYYCKHCLSRHVTVAMGSESAFPPKCCLAPIPLRAILLSLGSKQREEYQTKSAEYSLPPNERWYCPRTSCTKWIPPSKLSVNSKTTNYTCPFCSESICRTCRGPGHGARTECPQDFGLEQTLEVAQAEGWQRCYSCSALVEHTSGCRHMTCKCRAEFCYVCGARWQTCGCTESDAVNRRTNLNRRRQERIDALNAELEEIARAIAEVQEMERAEAEERRAREEERARQEAELLATLEQERLEEEAARQAAEEEAERVWQEVMKKSLEDDLQRLQLFLRKVLDHQLSTLNSRHEAKHATVANDLDGGVDAVEKKYTTLLETVNMRYARKRTTLRTAQKTESEALDTQQEEEADDMFIQIHMRLKGKQNKESRMERMFEELRKAQADAKEELIGSHTQALCALEVRKKVDVNGINGARTVEAEAAKAELDQRLFRDGIEVGADRKFFEMVTKRRLAMLDMHKEIAFAELSNRKEPRGLQDWHAATCDPILPDFSGDEEMTSPVRPSGFNIGSGRERTGSLVIPSPDPREEKIPHIVESSSPYEGGERIPDRRPHHGPIPGAYARGDAYLQPVPPPSRYPPTPPSSAVSIEAPYARRPTSETVRRLEDSSQTLSQVHSRSESLGVASPTHERHNSMTSSLMSTGSSEHRPSLSSTTKKSRSWFKKKDVPERDMAKLLRASVGDAF